MFVSARLMKREYEHAFLKLHVTVINSIKRRGDTETSRHRDAETFKHRQGGRGARESFRASRILQVSFHVPKSLYAKFPCAEEFICKVSMCRRVYIRKVSMCRKEFICKVSMCR